MKLFGKKEKPIPFVTAVILAAGASRRMGGENKQMMELSGIPVLGRSMLAFEGSPYIREIIVVAAEDQVVTYAELGAALKIGKLTKVIRGGQTRLESAYLGACEASEEAKYLAVHDGARPLVTQKIIADCCEAAFLHTASAAGVPVNDTIKEVDKKRCVVKTVDRANLMAMQTPQAADKALLLAALQSAKDAGAAVTDECAALERLGVRPFISAGSYENIKLTTPADLAVAQAIFERRGEL